MLISPVGVSAFILKKSMQTFSEEILAENCPYLNRVSVPHFFEVVKPRFLQQTHKHTHTHKRETSPLEGRNQGITESNKLRKRFKSFRQEGSILTSTITAMPAMKATR